MRRFGELAQTKPQEPVSFPLGYLQAKLSPILTLYGDMIYSLLEVLDPWPATDDSTETVDWAGVGCSRATTHANGFEEIMQAW